MEVSHYFNSIKRHAYPYPFFSFDLTTSYLVILVILETMQVMNQGSVQEMKLALLKEMDQATTSVMREFLRKKG